MSSFFSANQFEREFSAKHLGNWEVPKQYPNRPVHRTGSTKIISNERGHLLPGIPRSKSNPWGDFKSTWQLPNKITREQAIALSSTPKVFNRKSGSRKLIDGHREDCHKEQDLSYKPGDLTEPDQQHHTRSILDDKSDVQLPQLNDLYVERSKSPKEPLENVIKYCDLNDGDVHSNRRSPNNSLIAKQIDELPEIPRTERRMNQEVSEKPGESNTIPLISAACNFQMARRMAQENLEHQPLPDSIMERAYLKLQAQGFTNPELALDVEPRVTGVGVRTHNAGPTHCTKLKVYRPKTCGVVPPPLNDPNYRPRTAFVPKTTKIEPMDLAICWDYRPANPLDEPKLPAHIDGSNDMAAPAVFSVVKTPRSIEDHNTGRSAGVFSHTAGEEGFFDKDIMLRSRNYFSAQLNKNTDRSCKCSIDSRSRSATRRSLQEQERIRTSNRCKSSPNLSLAVQPTECSPKESIIVCNYSKEHYHYRPEPIKCQKSSKTEGINHRTSRLCAQNVNKLNRNNNSKPEFKCAFKAGVPRSHSNGICSSFESTSNIGSSTGSEFTSKMIRIPKPIHPYKHKNYNIDTLAPPFACWKGGAGQGGYPEHWRLASVYQHAYKPIKQRKRPLLATVFQ